MLFINFTLTSLTLDKLIHKIFLKSYPLIIKKIFIPLIIVNYILTIFTLNNAEATINREIYRAPSLNEEKNYQSKDLAKSSPKISYGRRLLLDAKAYDFDKKPKVEHLSKTYIISYVITLIANICLHYFFKTPRTNKNSTKTKLA